MSLSIFVNQQAFLQRIRQTAENQQCLTPEQAKVKKQKTKKHYTHNIYMQYYYLENIQRLQNIWTLKIVLYSIKNSVIFGDLFF